MSRNETYKLSPPGRPNPIPASRTEKGGLTFTEKMLAKTPFAALFATGPEDPLKN